MCSSWACWSLERRPDGSSCWRACSHSSSFPSLTVCLWGLSLRREAGLMTATSDWHSLSRGVLFLPLPEPHGVLMLWYQPWIVVWSGKQLIDLLAAAAHCR